MFSGPLSERIRETESTVVTFAPSQERPGEATQSSPGPTGLDKAFQGQPCPAEGPLCASIRDRLFLTVPPRPEIIPIFQMGKLRLGEAG